MREATSELHEKYPGISWKCMLNLMHGTVLSNMYRRTYDVQSTQCCTLRATCKKENVFITKWTLTSAALHASSVRTDACYVHSAAFLAGKRKTHGFKTSHQHKLPGFG